MGVIFNFLPGFHSAGANGKRAPAITNAVAKDPSRYQPAKIVAAIGIAISVPARGRQKRSGHCVFVSVRGKKPLRNAGFLLPPLRDRKADIPLLAQHFVQHYARKIGKTIEGISPKVLKDLAAYDWPGNVRELEHLMERSILLADGTVIKDIYLPPVGQKNASKGPEESTVKTIDENERDHILAVLKKCNGRIWGYGGAAELLGVPPTTLNSKMKKLGIKKAFHG